MKKRNTAPVSKPRIPVKAENEIMEVLSKDLRIGTDEIVKILKKHNVSGDTEALQDILESFQQPLLEGLQRIFIPFFAMSAFQDRVVNAPAADPLYFAATFPASKALPDRFFRISLRLLPCL